MFTGIVEILGKITSIVPLDSSESGGQGFSITIGNAAEILGDCHLGDSIAVNGMFVILDFFYFFISVLCLFLFYFVRGYFVVEVALSIKVRQCRSCVVNDEGENSI